MTDLRDLYQQVILDHNRSPRNFRKVSGANRSAEGSNPICGDVVTVELRLEGDVIRDIGFQGTGCAISQASASLMTEAIKGKPRDEAEALFRAFHGMVTGSAAAAPDRDTLGKLLALGGVRQFPARVKCANLPWHAMHAALRGRAQPVSTEEGA
jgi:nitrogen fixation NifU-like protein